MAQLLTFNPAETKPMFYEGFSEARERTLKFTNYDRRFN